MTGVRITVTGTVLTQRCQPIAGAWLDFWQANAQGEYDNRGYTLRGHQLTDAKGRYALETILPGRYPGRPPHLHVKVRAPGQPTLTTQLYFPEAQPYNRSDPFFNPSLLVTWLDAPESRIAVYDFVLDLK
jgi:protocatechuate 3,4-dioxygenase beta subunit